MYEEKKFVVKAESILQVKKAHKVFFIFPKRTWTEY